MGILAVACDLSLAGLARTSQVPKAAPKAAAKSLLQRRTPPSRADRVEESSRWADIRRNDRAKAKKEQFTLAVAKAVGCSSAVYFGHSGGC